MNLDKIFRAYDIRGIFGDDLTEEIASRIGLAFGTFLGTDKQVVIGRDVRLSGEQIKNALVLSLNKICDVTDIGIVPTPLLYFALNYLNKDAGIMITASHNPPEWNGLKLFRREGCIFGDEMEKIKEIAEKVDLTELGGFHVRSNEYNGIIRDYGQFVLDKVKIDKCLRIVADTTNGVCGLLVPHLFRQLGCEILTLNEDPDGRFPAHLPEPKEDTLTELKEEVKRNRADFGVGYDGDGDRAVFVDNNGEVVPGDLALLVFAADVLNKSKGGKIVYEIGCSLSVNEFIKHKGGVPILERVGHTFIMDRMIREKALLGGERSSHFYFSEVGGMDDAIFASLKMAEILSRRNVKLSRIVDSLPKYPSIYEVNFNCPDEFKFEVIEMLKSKFSDLGLDFLDLDGIKLLEEDGWVLLRASNTQPIIRVSAEAKTEEKLSKIYGFVVEKLKEILKGC